MLLRRQTIEDCSRPSLPCTPSWPPMRIPAPKLGEGMFRMSDTAPDATLRPASFLSRARKGVCSREKHHWAGINSAPSAPVPIEPASLHREHNRNTPAAEQSIPVPGRHIQFRWSKWRQKFKKQTLLPPLVQSSCELSGGNTCHDSDADPGKPACASQTIDRNAKLPVRSHDAI